jgi:hypothetical protein
MLHVRQRRAIAAGFTNAKLREYTATFFDSAYKVCFNSGNGIDVSIDIAFLQVKAAWDAQLENEACIQINITPWYVTGRSARCVVTKIDWLLG